MKKHNDRRMLSRKEKLLSSSAGSQVLLLSKEAGFTLLELLICLALAAVIILGLSDILSTSLATRNIVHAENDAALQTEFAMDRMTRMVSGSRRLIIPLGENPATAWSESVRNVLAVTLPRTIDLDNNGIVDVDNDGDGLIDEDLPGDNNNDGAPGIIGIDDNGNGTTDISSAPTAPSNDDDEDNLEDEYFDDGLDNDSDGSIEEDYGQDMNHDNLPGVAGIDDDGDGTIDEGHLRDDDEDGLANEDWFDNVVYFLSGTTLIERLPVPWDEDGNSHVTGLDYVENPLAENVTRFEVTRQAQGGSLPVLVTILLELAGPSGEPYVLTATVRLGGGL